MVNSLREMNERRQAWMSEKPQFNSGNELRLGINDMAILQFIASGEDGDQFIKVYRSHSFDLVTANGRRNTQRYCPVQNGDGTECQWCAQGNAEVKERMSMWFYVYSILHTQLPQPRQGEEPKNFPQVQYENRIYFNEEVNGFKIWHTSAWRDSPWQDILKLAELYKGLQSFTAQLIRSGTGMQTRYKIVAMPNSTALPANIYAAAKEQCTSIPNLLKEMMQVPIVGNPATQQQPQNNQNQPANFNNAGITAWAPPGSNAPAPAAPDFTLPGAATVETPTAPETFEVPAAQPTQPEQPAQVETPAPVVQAPPQNFETPPPIVPQPPPQQEQQPAQTEQQQVPQNSEDNSRPLRSMF